MNIFSDFFNMLSNIGTVFYHTWWIILPPLLWHIFHALWVDYVAAYSPNSFAGGLKWTVLEIIPSRNIERGPKLMESVYTGLAGVTAGQNTFDYYIKGKWWQDRFSLELVGEEGVVHFYIRCQKQYRNMVEAQVYAQYPDAEIREVEDYTERFPKIIPNKNWDLWGTDFDFVKEAPLPIKTYDHFEEDITGTMIDPLAAVVEVLGALPPGQHIWLQYVIEPLPESWAKEADQTNVIKKLKGEAVAKPLGFFGDLVDVFSNIWTSFFGAPQFKGAEKKDLQPLEFRLSPAEKTLLKETEENLGRNFFKTKMRMIYLGRKDGFDKSFVGTFIGSLKQFNDMNRNQFKPEDISKTYGKIFFTEGISAKRKRKIYARYKKRNMDDVKVYFSAKELATVFHFPDMGVKSPSVLRVASKLGVAPPNLPVR